MTDKIYLLDSNILIYAIDISEKQRHEKSRSLIKKCFLGESKFAISIQNLSEFFVNATKKVEKPISKEDASNIINKIIEFDGFIKLELKTTTIVKALDIVNRSNSDYWDSLIAAAMLENNIFNIYTEDTKDFSRIQGINAVNPF